MRTLVLTLLATLIFTSTAIAGPFGADRIYFANPAADEATLTPEGLAETPAMEPFLASSGSPAGVQTRAWAMTGDSALHVIVECMEPSMDTLVAELQPAEKDVYVFSDDCVEVFVSPTGSEEDYFHFGLNANNAHFDERVKTKSWAGEWTSEVHRADDRWWLRVDIPYETLNARPRTSVMWWLNVSRQRRAGGKLQLSSWSDAGNDFHEITHWGRAIFSDDYATILDRYVLQPWRVRVDDLNEIASIDNDAQESLQQALTSLREDLAPVREAVEAGGPDETARFSQLLATGEEALDQLRFIEEDLGAGVHEREVARRIRKLADGRSVIAWPVRAMTNRRIMPAPEPRETLGEPIRMRACPGEIEPASFVVYPVGREMTVLPLLSDLDGPGLGLRADRHFDIHAIKRWYQAGEGGTRFPFKEEGVRALVPELLLHDDSLVKVDHEKRDNYLKLRREDGEEYIWISFPRGEDAPWGPEGRANLTDEPVYDTEELQPVTIPADTAKQFWLTARVPDYAPAGTYQGEIAIRSGDEIVETLDLELEVLPFELAENPLESSVYFHWGIELIDEPGSLKFNRRSASQYRAELRNLLEHGVDNPTMGVTYDSGDLPLALMLREQVGMANDHLYYLKGSASMDPAKAAEIVETAQRFGFEDVYFYGRDEAKGEALRKQREAWERLHEVGGKVFVAGQHHTSFPEVGDIQDLLVCHGDLKPEAAEEWHSEGHKIFSYANPQSGLEEPETYRRNFGLALAAAGYDGGMTYVYYHGWNDFSGDRYRQHNFIYPTMDGCVDTVQWEGYREGIDDLRYLGTLQEAIGEAREAGGERARLAEQAQHFIDEMDVSGDLYELRDEMIEWILRLRG